MAAIKDCSSGESRAATIRISLADLWAAYAGRTTASGRVACPVTTPHGAATHIYKGFGAIRLEAISGKPQGGRGFQGAEIAAATIAKASATQVTIDD